MPVPEQNGPPVIRRPGEFTALNEYGMEEPRLDLLKYVNILIRNRWLIAVGSLACAALAIVYTSRLEPVYKAEASFFPSRSQAVTSRMDTQFGASRTYSDSLLQDSRLVEYYSKILASYSFLEKVAQKTVPNPLVAKPGTLVAFYEQEGANEGERLIKTTDVIRENLNIITPRAVAGRAASVMTISYSAPHPVLAANIANAVIEELIAYNQSEATSQATQNRVFIEEQLKEAGALLQNAEAELARFEAENKLLVTPEPQITLARLKRDVRLREEVFFTLIRQLELAKIEEQENRALIEVIQRAVPPMEKSSPSYKRNTLLAFFAGFFLFCGVAFVRERLSKIDTEDKSTREFIESLNEVKGDFVKAGRLIGLGKKRDKKRSR